MNESVSAKEDDTVRARFMMPPGGWDDRENGITRGAIAEAHGFRGIDEQLECARPAASKRRTPGSGEAAEEEFECPVLPLDRRDSGSTGMQECWVIRADRRQPNTRFVAASISERDRIAREPFDG